MLLWSGPRAKVQLAWVHKDGCLCRLLDLPPPHVIISAIILTPMMSMIFLNREEYNQYVFLCVGGPNSGRKAP